MPFSLRMRARSGEASPALPGAVHDIRAARGNGIIDALTEAGINCWADKGYRGAGGTVRTPYWGRWETLSAGQQAVNRSHTKIRALVEQAVAAMKSWRLLRKLRCSTTRITSLVQAVLTLHLTSSGLGGNSARLRRTLRSAVPPRDLLKLWPEKAQCPPGVSEGRPYRFWPRVSHFIRPSASSVDRNSWARKR